MKSLLSCLLIVLIQLGSHAQVVKHTFNVEFKGKSIGHIYALKKTEGDKELFDLTTNTDVSILAFSVHVESEIELIKKNGSLMISKCYRHSNRGSEDIVSHVEKVDNKKYKIEKNNKITSMEGAINYCIVDMYFKEPMDHQVVFSNMHTGFININKIEEHSFEVETPDGNSTLYHYQNGNLISIEMKTKVGDVICTRVQ